MLSAARELRELIEEFEDAPEYIAYGLVSDFVDEVCRAMDEQGITRAELAAGLGVTPQYVTKFLNSTETLQCISWPVSPAHWEWKCTYH